MSRYYELVINCHLLDDQEDSREEVVGFEPIRIGRFLTEERALEVAESYEDDAEGSLPSCDCCNKIMTEGFVINEGEEHYCCESCLHSNMSEEEYLGLFDNGDGSSYWTKYEE